jgi:hypothetical protein
VKTGVAILLTIVALTSPALAAQREFTYSLGFRGAITADRTEFARVVAHVYADPRGWSLGNEILFRRVPDGGDFTIWLASPDVMTLFSSACNAAWSCRAGRDVVINQARWVYGSPFWFGNLSDYRIMIINHETGHWLGLNHERCPATGDLAPVMMQQSEGAAPCESNAWPLATERNTVARLWGVPSPGK